MNLQLTMDDILARRASMRFNSVVLSQIDQAGQVAYEGTGVLEELLDGRLSIRIDLTRPIPIEDVFRGINGPPSGQIIGDDNHFSLKAIQDDGTVWVSPYVLAEGKQINFGTGLGTVHVRPKYLTTTLEKISPRDGALRTFVIDGKLPLRLKAFILGADISLDIKANEQRTEVTLAHPDNVEEAQLRHVSNALAVLSGESLKWLCDVFEQHDLLEITIWSCRRDPLSNTLPTPIPNLYDANANFIMRFASHGDTLGKFIDHWMSIYNAWGSSSAMAALPLSVSIEGLINTYFPQLKIEAEDAIAAAAAAVAAMRGLDVSDELRQRLIGSVSNIGRGSIPRALKVLTAQGLLTRELASSYGIIRNRAAHAVDEEYSNLASAQASVDKIFSCLSLFYRLLLIRLEYRGPVVEHSLFGCPAGTFNPENAAAALAAPPSRKETSSDLPAN